jgi:hypothetical protein
VGCGSESAAGLGFVLGRFGLLLGASLAQLHVLLDLVLILLALAVGLTEQMTSDIPTSRSERQRTAPSATEPSNAR